MDRLKLTPLLVAAWYGSVDSFHFLLKLGARKEVKSQKGFNAVQCALMNKQRKLVLSLLDNPEFTVINDIIHLFSADNVQISELANVLEMLNIIIASYIVSQKGEKPDQAYISMLESVDGVSKLMSLIDVCLKQKEMLQHVAPIIVKIMQNMSFSDTLSKAMMENSMPEYHAKLMDKINSSEALVGLIEISEVMFRLGRGEKMASLHTPRICLRAARRTKDEQVILTAVSCMGKCASYSIMAENFLSDGILAEFVNMLKTSEVSFDIQKVLMQILTTVASINESFRRAILELGGVHVIIDKLNWKKPTLIDIINFLRVMCKEKGDMEVIMKRSKIAIPTLLYVIKNSINYNNKQKAFGILWLIAGKDLRERRALARLIGPAGLVRMLSLGQRDLQLIAITAFYLLSPNLYNMHEEIVKSGAIALLLSSIQSTGPTSQLEALWTIENCSHDIAYCPNKKLQEAFMNEGGIQVLQRLQVHGQNKSIKLQAICTLSAISIGNLNMKKIIFNNPQFSLKEFLLQLTTLDPDAEINNLMLVWRSICYLAYNSIEAQHVIFQTMAIPVKPYLQIMHSACDMISTEVAFQMIVNARILDLRKNKVQIVAMCMKHLVFSLKSAFDEQEDDLQVHICTLITALLHMRAGICPAFMSINIIPLLVHIIFTPFESCRRTAAIALSYITKDKDGCRKVLGYCRKYKDLYRRIIRYSKGFSLDPEFIAGWKHFQSIYLRQQQIRTRSPLVLPSASTHAKLFSK